MNYVQMKTTELNMLWKLMKSGERRPLTAADLALLLRIWFALQEYEAAVEQRQPQITDAHVTVSGDPVVAG